MYTFNADVTVQSRCNECANHCKDVASGLKAVFRDTKIAGVDHVLALVTVHEKTVEHIDEVDEQLRTPHSLKA